MANIRVELQLEDGSFVSGVRRAGQTLAEFKRELARTDPHFRQLAASGRESFLSVRRTDEQVRSFGQTLRSVTFGLGAAHLAFAALSGASNGTIGNIVRLNAEMEKLRFQMAGMSTAADSMKDATDQVKYLQTLATSTPFALGALSNSFVKLKAAGIDPANGSLKALTDGLASFGASDEHLHRVTIALTQMQGKGVLSMEELRQQLGESMPNAMRLMSRSMGVTVGELAKLVSTGTVESKAALDKFMTEVRLSYSGTGEMMMETFSGQMARLRTALTRQITSGETKRAFDQLKQIIGDVADYMGSFEASQLFDTIGRGLQTAMFFGEAFVRALGDIRDVLVFLKPVLPFVFGGAVLLAGASRMSRAITSMKMGYLDLKSSANSVSHALRNLHAGASIGAMSAAGAVKTSADAAAAAALAAQARNASAAQQGMASSVAAAGNRVLGPMLAVGRSFLGLLGPIAFGLGVILPIVFQIGKGIVNWVRGVKETNEVLETTAEGRLRVLEETNRQEEQVLRDRLARLNEEEMAYIETHGRNNSWRLKQMELLQDQLVDLESRNASKTAELQEEVFDEQVKAAEKRIATAVREFSNAYNQAMAENDTLFNEELEEAGRTDGSLREVQERNRLRIIDLRKKRIEEEIRLHNEEIAALQAKGEEDENNLAIAGRLIEARNRLIEQRDQLAPEQLTIELLIAPEDDSRREERLQRFFNNARDKVEDLSAELNGASGAVAKLAFQIRRGDFGRLQNGTEEAEKMRDALLATTIAAEALDEILSDLNNAQGEIDRIAENLLEENLKLQAELDGINTDDALAMWRWRRARGEIQGLGETAEETVRQAIEKVTQGVDLSASSLENLSNQIRNNAFGDESVRRIDEVAAALGRVRGQTDGIVGAMAGLNFSVFGGTGVPNIATNVDGGILDLIAKVESGGDYNATLDNGRWTNGPQNLTSMTLNQIRALQQGMRTPENRALYGNGAGSSALGRYQIVGQTLEGLIKEMGLTGDELFDEKMQDAMATRLLGRRGANPAALRNEWEGLNRVSDADIMAAIGRSTTGPTNVAAQLQRSDTDRATTPAALKTTAASSVVGRAISMLDEGVYDRMISGAQSIIEKIDAAEARAVALDDENLSLEGQVYLKRMTGRISQSAASMTNEDGEDERYGKFGRQVRADRASGENQRISDEEWDEITRLADAEDARLERIKERARAQKEATENEKRLNEDLVEIDQRRADALAQVKDPNYRAQSADMSNLIKLEREQLDLVAKIHGINSDEYALEVARLAQQRMALNNAEAAEALVELTRAAEESEMSAITNVRESRRREFQDRVAELTALRDQAIRDGALVAEAEKQYERAVAAERELYRHENRTSLMATIDEMSRMGDNINEKSGEWARSLSDTLYDYVSGGEAGWADFGNVVREGIARSLTDGATAIFLKPFERAISGDGTPGSGLGGLIEKSLEGLITLDKGSNSKGAAAIQSQMTGMVSGLGEMMKSSLSGLGSWLSSIFSKSGFFPVKHTGGVVGAGGGWGRSAPVSVFAGAPKFHTGGIIGKPNIRKGLSPSEVPIIAKKGEGVFTPEQMKHLGGTLNSQSVSINAPITVNASGGTAEQNEDLARQVARQSETMFRRLVQDEIVQQMRPGGMMRR